MRVAWSAADGQRIAKGTTFGTLHGSALSILTAERVALNFMQRMSGVATATAAVVAAVQVGSWRMLAWPLDDGQGWQLDLGPGHTACSRCR